jgi:hypothetical protein
MHAPMPSSVVHEKQSTGKPARPLWVYSSALSNSPGDQAPADMPGYEADFALDLQAASNVLQAVRDFSILPGVTRFQAPGTRASRVMSFPASLEPSSAGFTKIWWMQQGVMD